MAEAINGHRTPKSAMAIASCHSCDAATEYILKVQNRLSVHEMLSLSMRTSKELQHLETPTKAFPLDPTAGLLSSDVVAFRVPSARHWVSDIGYRQFLSVVCAARGY